MYTLDAERVSPLGRRGVHSQRLRGETLSAVEGMYTLDTKRVSPLGRRGVHSQRLRGQTLSAVEGMYTLDTERVSPLGRRGVHSQRLRGQTLSAVEVCTSTREFLYLDGREEKLSAVESVYSRRRGETLSASKVYIPSTAERRNPLGVESVHTLNGREEKPSRRRECTYPQRPRGFPLLAVENAVSRPGGCLPAAAVGWGLIWFIDPQTLGVDSQTGRRFWGIDSLISGVSGFGIPAACQVNVFPIAVFRESKDMTVLQAYKYRLGLGLGVSNPNPNPTTEIETGTCAPIADRDGTVPTSFPFALSILHNCHDFKTYKFYLG
ncbi:uncharacterized protein PGTG_18347 [Puccinia graminis f. sp. tritici CRL 75-36-700-3]|uniref:Uncharacterized protein n=1 Tax=Puccinia graminis f. sp. tritici (strain CRL 75-36-700-3 / race SCCL) TaxID=418459 RepID=E3L737_PUCGT|nr:uncharacterized protein PGTG_18347 [Puccinia graminis f. sp. tritici CRL 75-36-700-3]EFP92360.1 hypothetical protein PGTG_18347 [Puccinia graminis f. sp. tritici CRL 75-36-700-3]